MLSEQNLNIVNGNISTGIEPNDSINAVIEFIKNNFKGFSTFYKSKKANNEKGLNQKLCIFLNQNLKNEPFFFQHEFIENTESGSSPQVDIGTIAKVENMAVFENEYTDDSFFSLEAKRLPQERKDREKEYVIGSDSVSGAMERFKKGIHGSRIKFAAIVGYIQSDDFDHWFLKINSWIEELANDDSQEMWTLDDKIKKCSEIENELFTEMISENSRTVAGRPKDKISIFHFWVNLIER